MKLHIITTYLLCAALAIAQTKVSERPLLSGATIDADADWIGISDMSETAGARDKKTSLTEFWKKLGGTNVSAAELGYLDGVTSALQTQINAKEAALGNPGTNGYVLSSTTGGSRSWMAMSGGGSTMMIDVTASPYNAARDAKRTDVADMTNGSTSLTTTGYSGFSAGDVGKKIVVYGAGSAGAPLVTTIATYVSATSITLSAAASTTVADETAIWGTDDTAAIDAAIEAAKVSTVTRAVYLPIGQYMCNVVLDQSNLQIIGAGSRMGFLAPTGTTNNQAGSLGTVLFAANPSEPVITSPGANNFNAMIIKNLALVGCKNQVGYGLEIGEREFAVSGYPGHSWEIANVNMIGFEYAMIVASAGSATVERCAASYCDYGFYLAETPFTSSNGQSDNVVFSAIVTTYTDYPFMVGGSKNTVLLSGDFNYPIVFATLRDNARFNFVGFNVEEQVSSQAVFDLGDGCTVNGSHVQCLTTRKGAIIRDLSNKAVANVQPRVAIDTCSSTMIYQTAAGSYFQRPEKIAGGVIETYVDSTFASRLKVESTNRSIAEAFEFVSRVPTKTQESWTKMAASPFGDWNWVVTQIGGNMALRSASGSNGVEFYSTNTTVTNSGRLMPERAQYYFTAPRKLVMPVRITAMTSAIARVGWYSLDGSASMTPTHGIGIKVDTTGGADTTLKFEFRNSGTVTQVDTGVAVGNTQTYYLVIERTTTGFACTMHNYASPFSPIVAQVHLACSPAGVYVAPGVFSGVSATGYAQINLYPGGAIEDTAPFTWIAP